MILLMEEIMPHLGCIKACKSRDIYHINWLAELLNHLGNMMIDGSLGFEMKLMEVRQ